MSKTWSLCEKIALRRDDGHLDNRTLVVLAVALLCLTAPMELSQLAFAFVGAMAYATAQALHISTSRPAAAKGALASKPVLASADRGGSSNYRRQSSHSTSAASSAAIAAGAACFRQPSSQPISAPSFRAQGWEAEVAELLDQISPTTEGDRVVQQLANLVQQSLRRLVPEVEVFGFASGDLVRGTAFGVAVPEVDIVVSVSPTVLASRLQSRLSGASASSQEGQQPLDARKLQKSAIRAFTDRLVSTSGFKFRRSAFRGQEPKVTLLAPAALGIYSEAVPVDFTVNSSTPLYNAALLAECGRLEPRARDLILLVKRWAKDRGVCHAAKGHLSPYTWSLLAIFFLQTAAGDEEGCGPLLPQLEYFHLSSGLMGSRAAKHCVCATPATSAVAPEAQARPAWTKPLAQGSSRKSTAALFKDFVRFYCRDFDWRKEAISVRLGKRAPPALLLPLHIVVHNDNVTTEVGPSIEDPFEVTRNLGECTTATSLARLREELARAEMICSAERPSLSELLEPWVPPERDGTDPVAPED